MHKNVHICTLNVWCIPQNAPLCAISNTSPSLAANASSIKAQTSSQGGRGHESNLFEWIKQWEEVVQAARSITLC